MTDAEILKAWEWCEHFENNIVLKGKGDEKCVQALQVMGIVRNVLKDYDRQKAENKELMEDNADLNETVLNLLEQIKTIKAEARKEFAKKIKKKMRNCIKRWVDDIPLYLISEGFVDSLLKETEGDS